MTVPARGSSLHRGQPDVPYYYGGERPELLAVVPRDRRRVLELGCGVGAFASEFLKTNSAAEYWGVQPFHAAAAEDRQHLYRMFDRLVEQVYVDGTVQMTRARAREGGAR
jgi:spermidine synthase